jgi:hypothetical protein
MKGKISVLSNENLAKVPRHQKIHHIQRFRHTIQHPLFAPSCYSAILLFCYRAFPLSAAVDISAIVVSFRSTGDDYFKSF